jgi:hypothetical protein
VTNFPQKKPWLLTLTACVALAAVLAETFIFAHLDHDCCGEGCPVCAQIEAAQRLLEGLARTALFTLFAWLFAAHTKTLVRSAGTFFPSTLTPVFLKTKLTC